jgi:soluble lytic murein transglycosylase
MPEANHWLAEAASEPHSFYGLLAGHLTGHSAETSWSWRLPEFNQRASDIVAESPAGVRALALVQIGQNDMAESELLRLSPSVSASLRRDPSAKSRRSFSEGGQGHHALHEAMLALAEKEHMASLALKLGGMATGDDGKTYDAALYPVPPWQPKGGYQIDRALMYALIRHESQFDPMAVSSQGACGLMQLMPSTAALMSGTSSNHSKGGECPEAFFDPATNLGLGQNYVRHLADQPMIGDNLLLLLAAYNGGPGRLSQRTDTQNDADPLLFMEGLSAQETHDYVQQVLIQYWTYSARLHQPLKSLDQLAHGEWPRFALHDTVSTREASLQQTPGITVASNLTVH